MQLLTPEFHSLAMETPFVKMDGYLDQEDKELVLGMVDMPNLEVFF
jgi:hypothetical protein